MGLDVTARLVQMRARKVVYQQGTALPQDPDSAAASADRRRHIAPLALMVNMLWIRRAININIDIGCWKQSGPLAEVKALESASSYGTFFEATGTVLSMFLFHQKVDVASSRGYGRLRQQTEG